MNRLISIRSGFALPRHLNEKVAALHLEKIMTTLTTLRDDQAGYVGVEKQAVQVEQYRY